MKHLFLGALCAMICLNSCDSNNGNNNEDPKQQTEETTATKFEGTLVVDQLNETFFTQENATVDYQITETEGVVLNFYQVKFSERMPISLDMKVCNVQYTTEGGSIAFSGNNLVPQAMGGEFPDYTITNLSGTISDGIMNFSMNCGKYPLTYSGKESK